MLDTLTARWFTDDFCAAHPEVIDWRKKQVMDTNPDVFLNVFDIYAETEMGPWLHEITAPSQVLTGELSGGCNPRLNKQIAAALPHSELVILDGLKHAIFIEATDRVLPPVREYSCYANNCSMISRLVPRPCSTALASRLRINPAKAHPAWPSPYRTCVIRARRAGSSPATAASRRSKSSR